LNNLQRQILFDETDVSEQMPKATAAARRLAEINSSITVEAEVTDVNASNVERLVDGIDLILDGTDNFATRYLINDVAVKHGIPWVYGGCVGSYGVVMPVRPGVSPCIRCAFPDPAPPGSSPTCDTAGVLNGIAGIVSGLQATEALKILTGATEDLIPGLLNIDVWENEYRTFRIERSEGCPTCGKGEYPFLEPSAGMTMTSLCGRNAVQVLPPRSETLNLKTVADKLQALGEVTYNDFLLKFEQDGVEITLFRDARAIIKGTDDPERARVLYDKWNQRRTAGRSRRG
jgi:adenylyltransferase/sulfurtransferase